MPEKIKNKPLIVRTEVDGSPFILIKQNGTWIITMGRYKLCANEFDTEDQALEWLEKNTWNVVATMCGIISEFNINEQSKIKQHDNN